MKSCLLCGVGGQGTVLASRILAAAAIEKGFFARTAETIGMAQRGGCVVSHVRIGDDVLSPLIPLGRADAILAFEPGEGVRNLPYLRCGGIMIASDRTIQPVTSSLSGAVYDGAAMISYMKCHTEKCVVLSTREVEDICGSEKAMNVALAGALAESGIMGLSMDDVEKAVQQKVKPQFVEMNLKALAYGAEMMKNSRRTEA